MLFKIDPRPYKAQYDQAAAQVGLYQSQLKLAKANYERDLDLSDRTKGAGVSKAQLDADVAQQEQAEAAVKAAQASLEVYKLNLDFCTVKSPIDGQVGRSNMPRGNLVSQDSTLLTTVQSVDPMYVYFDMDTPSYRKFQAGMSTGCRTPRSPCRWRCKAKRDIRARGPSISSTTSSIPPPIPSWCAACSPTPRRRSAGI